MQINGFQKLTLLDFPEKVACIVFTAGCNFRCPFCHNASLVTHIDNSNVIAEQEVLEYLKKRKGILEGVSITGGEPLLQGDIEEFIEKVKALGYAVKLDTNGTFPDKLIRLVERGLIDYVAMDIKNSKEKYANTAGVTQLDLSNIQKSIDYLLEGKVDFEFRTTVVNGLHNVEDIQDIVKWIKGTPKYYLQNFVDSGDILQKGMSSIEKNELEKMLQAAQTLIPTAQIRSES